ncbi:hypothetical protein HPB50_011867 [Hyalomma asiaticum]|uniref:Uncharacterized protein n=1 Tax=Hyalomma asiaticum TaxID=266040 RepID=A0ACB7SMR7_HYAAI|nr:hypothetical protein HPB50_011867 [Hyalomma asiaticum]
MWVMNCLLLHIASPKASGLLRSMKLLPLPTSSQLNQIVSRVPCEYGYNAVALETIQAFFEDKPGVQMRCVENAFGITVAMWRILLRTINLLPENVDYIIKGACVLDNFLTVHNPHSHQFPDKEDSFGNVGGCW